MPGTSEATTAWRRGKIRIPINPEGVTGCGVVDLIGPGRRVSALFVMRKRALGQRREVVQADVPECLAGAAGLGGGTGPGGTWS